MATTKTDPPTDVLTQAMAQVGEMLARVEKRRMEVLDRRQKALEETMNLAGTPELRKGVRDKEQLARLDAVAQRTKERLGRVEEQRAALAEAMKKARAAVAPSKKKRRRAADA